MPLTPRDRRTLIIGGAIMGVILVAFLLFNVFFSGSDTAAGPSFAPLASGSGGPVPTGSSSGGPSVAPSATKPPSVPLNQNFSGRDPFSVPPDLSSTAAGTPTGGGTGTGTGTGTSTPPPSGGGTGTSTGPPPTNPGGGSSIVIGGHTVVLLDTFPRGGKEMAQVEIDGTVYDVAVGSKFAAGAFKLTATSGSCATFLFGDQPFSLCATASK
jgi:hypothetical protein